MPFIWTGITPRTKNIGLKFSGHRKHLKSLGIHPASIVPDSSQVVKIPDSICAQLSPEILVYFCASEEAGGWDKGMIRKDNL